jgi:WD40 repeat protein
VSRLLRMERWQAASGSSDKTVKVWDLEVGKALATFTCDAAVLCCAWADARQIVAGDASGRLHLLVLERESSS